MLEASTHRPAALGESRGKSMVFQGMHLRADLQGPLLRADIEQRFVNRSDEAIEAVYTFPLPFDAVILEVRARLGDREISGSVIARPDAEQRYEQAVAEGDAALMVESNPDGSVTLNLGNLLPGEGCTVRIRYGQLLRFEQRGLRLVVPTVIAPRYGDPIRDGGLQPHQVVEPDLEAEHPFALELRLHGALARAGIESPSHAIRCEREDGQDLATIRLAPDARLDRDFVLVLQGLEHDSLLLLQADTLEPGSTALLGGLCAHLPAEAPSVAMHLLVDCSGSMAGDSIAAARQALHSIMSGLRAGDRFSLSRFGSAVEHRSSEFWAADEARLLAARHWIDDLQADLGGTAMEKALQSTLALAEESPADILLLTDGEVHAIDAVIATARRGGRRIFVVGIGSSPAEAHLRRLAEATAGACDFVGPAEKVEPAMLRMFARMRSPRMGALRLENLGDVQPAWLCGLEGAAFDGDTLHLAGAFRGALPSQILLTGMAADGGRHTVASARVEPVVGEDSDVARMAVALRLRREELDAKQGTELAVRYQLLSQSTSFLLTVQREDGQRSDGLPSLHKVRPMLAAGWGAVGSVRAAAMDEHFVASVSMSSSFSPNKAVSERRSSNYSIREELPRFSMASRESSHAIWPLQASKHDHRRPSQVRRWLRASRVEDWPTTIAGLQALGIPALVLVWLETELALRRGSAVNEERLVRAFLDALCDLLVAGEHQTLPARQLDDLGRKLRVALAGITHGRWVLPRSNDSSTGVEP